MKRSSPVNIHLYNISMNVCVCECVYTLGHSVEKAVMQCETYAIHLLRMLTEGTGSDVSMGSCVSLYCASDSALDHKHVCICLSSKTTGSSVLSN